MFKRKKLVISLVLFLACITIWAQNVYSQENNSSSTSGWDYIQNNSNSKQPVLKSIQQSNNETQQKVYKEGDIEQGILNIADSFKAFDDSYLISLKLRDSDVREVLSLLAKEGGKSIVLDNSVSGTVNCELDNVSRNKAMDLILAAAELDARVVDNTIFVASKPAMLRKGLNRRFVKSFKLNYANPLDVASIINASIFNKGLSIESSTKEESKAAPGANMAIAMQATSEPATNATQPLTISPQNMSPSASNQQQNSPAAANTSSAGSVSTQQVRSVRTVEPTVLAGTNYNNAGALAGTISIQGDNPKNSSYVVDNNSGGAIVIPDTRTNTILIAGLEDEIANAEKTIACLDKPLKQVSIEVSLIEINRTDSADLGINFGADTNAFTAGYNSPSSDSGIGYASGPILVPNSQPSYSTITDTALNPFAKTIGLTTPLGGTSLQISSIKNITKNVVVKLNALMSRNKVKLIANPNVVAVDGAESLIKLTEQIVNRIDTSYQGVNGEIRIRTPQLADVGIVLNILPKISKDGYVTLRIRPSVTSPGETIQIDDVTVTPIKTREAIIQNARMKSGETLAIGGLITENESSTDFKVPVLGDIPFFGNAFHQKTSRKSKTELIILLTPKIIDDVATEMDPLSIPASVPIN